jgi:MIP family channel proteins
MAMRVSIAALLAEFFAMWLFVIIGCGSAMATAGQPGWLVQVSLAFGLAITALAYSIGHYSGGHINCAVTLGLVLVKACDPIQGCCNILVQTLGSILGAATLCIIFPEDADRTGGLGSNAVSITLFSRGNALAGEIVFTFLLMFVVLQTAVNKKSEGSRAQACIAIGFAVFLAHCVMIPIDGCSINPTRSIGPAIVSKIRNADTESKALEDLWVFIFGPFVGAALAAGVYLLIKKLEAPEAPAEKDDSAGPIDPGVTI